MLQNVRDQLNKRGAKTIRGLGRVFRSMDSFDGNRSLDRQEFLKGLQNLQVELSTNDANHLMGVLDKSGDGLVDFNEFLEGIRVRYVFCNLCF